MIRETILECFEDNLDWGRRDVRQQVWEKLYKDKYTDWRGVGEYKFEQEFNKLVKEKVLIHSRYIDGVHNAVKLYKIDKGVQWSSSDD